MPKDIDYSPRAAMVDEMKALADSKGWTWDQDNSGDDPVFIFTLGFTQVRVVLNTNGRITEGAVMTSVHSEKHLFDILGMGTHLVGASE